MPECLRDETIQVRLSFALMLPIEYSFTIQDDRLNQWAKLATWIVWLCGELYVQGGRVELGIW